VKPLAYPLLADENIILKWSPRCACRASDALQTFVQQRWPGARWRREVPLAAELLAYLVHFTVGGGVVGVANE
jgi:hypothetical protein